MTFFPEKKKSTLIYIESAHSLLGSHVALLAIQNLQITKGNAELLQRFIHLILMKSELRAVLIT